MTPGRGYPRYYRYAPADLARDAAHSTGCGYPEFVSEADVERSIARTSYHHRITRGPACHIREAMRINVSRARNLRRSAGQTA